MNQKKIAITLTMWVLVFALSGCRQSKDQDSSPNRLSSTEEVFTSTEVNLPSVEALETEMTMENSEAVAPAYGETVLSMEAGDVVDTDILNASAIPQLFTVNPISEQVLNRITGISYTKNPDIAPDQLRYLKMLYYGFDGKTHVGEMIVNEKIAADVQDIFLQLYQEKYPIEEMTLIDAYQGDDESSMDANNTSAFNYRTVAGSSKLSNHSFGMAIDLNPKYNPYVKVKSDGTTICQPQSGSEYIDRSAAFEHKITRDDLAYQLFLKAGFTWGGDFNSLKDYQHFEKEDSYTQ